MTPPTNLHVAVQHPYEVIVGNGILDLLDDLVPGDALRIAIIYAPPLDRLATTVRDALATANRRVHLVEVPPGETGKRLEVAGQCWSALGRAGFTRSDLIIGLGGGAVTDLAGFAAATWLRGVPVIHIPTTVLGMVDAAIGGKTAINTTEGKNLVGAFHDPVGVLCDLDVLRELPRAEILSGLAEVIKCGFIADPTILEDVEGDPGGAVDPTTTLLRSLVERAIQVKIAVITRDPYETDRTAVGREVLNYGHTLGHAIERLEGYRWRHGEAVSVGMVYAAELSRALGRLDDDAADRHRSTLARLGLPTTYRGDAWLGLLDAMKIDKKSRGDQLRFVVLEAIARPVALDGPDPDLLATAFRQLAT